MSVLAATFGLASLRYPLGHDQSIHFVVAREWLLHGALPYRDFFDHKPPGIYLLHMLAMRVFGVHTWAIRPIEIATVLVLGWTTATLTVSRDRSATGRYGTVALATSFLYFGFFTFLSTAQPELWATTFVVGAIAAARRVRHERRAAIMAGALSGGAMMMKPTIAPFVVAAIALLAMRATRRARALAWFGVAVTIPVGVLVAIFASHGALGTMADVLVSGNDAYVRHARTIHSLDDFVRCSFELFGWFHPMSTMLLVATLARFVVCRVHREPAPLRRWAFGVVLVGAGYVSVVGQLKFHIYHYVTIVPGAAMLLVFAIEDATRRARTKCARTACVGVAIAIVLATYPLSGRRARTWWAVNEAELRLLAGRGTPAAVDATFVSAGGRAYDYGESRAVGLWVRDHSRPSDRIAVRGCSPEVYAIAERSPAGRFFWTTAYTHAMWTHRGAEWEAEDHRALDATPPRFVVLREGATRPESAVYFEKRGYALAAHVGRFVVLERGR